MMKTFLKIAGAVALLLLLFVIGLNLYFTDDKLKNTIMPYIDESVGRPVQVESMSVTLFKTFPNPGIEVNNLQVPGDTEEDTLLSMEQFVAGVKLFPLFRNEINITELILTKPQFTYKLYADSTTNLDFLTEEETDTSSAGYNISIPYFQVTDGHFGYRDFTTNTSADLNDVDGNLSLAYADSIQSSIDMEVGEFHATVDSVEYLSGLPVRLTQESVIHTDNEQVRLTEGTLAIRGLEMDLTGSLSNWSKAFTVDLNFSSSTDNFGDLLRLVPEAYAESIEGLESSGTLDLGGSVQGPITADSIPRFDVRVHVEDGYLKDPDLPQPIEDIQISANATNELVTIQTFNALAGSNSLSGSGTLNNPLEDNGTFDLDFVADVDLSTVHQFYDISEMDIEQLGGQLDIDANAEGQLDQPENAIFDGKAILADGLLKYQDVLEAIRNINIDAAGTQELFTINSLSLQAAENSLSANGEIQHLLDENNRYINMDTNLKFNLATIKEFYPIDEDTLRMEGILTAQAILNGQADQIERAVQKGTIKLSNGFIQHKSLDNPIQEITFNSTLNGPTLNISEASFITGDNNLSADGNITNYLSDNRSINLNISGEAMLQEITNYYNLEPGITTLNGVGDLNIRARGPLNQPEELQLTGDISLQEVNMAGDNLVQPVSNLNGKLKLNPQNATLSSLNFNLGSSDINIQGTLTDYMAYLKNPKERSSTPRLQGSFSSSHLNLDELIDWTDTTRTEMPIHLPDLRSTVDADIKEMILTGITMKNVRGKASTTPEQIALDQATANLLGGTATGSLTWEVLRPDQTTISFSGKLDNLRAGSFFEEYPVLGEKSKLHQYLEGTFNAEVDYESGLNVYLEPQLPTSTMEGTFGMSKAVLEGHPVQVKLAERLNAGNLKRMALDKWESSYNLKNRLFTINNLSLTSGNIGVELDGNKHLVSEVMDYQMTLYLPSRFDKAIASLISDRALKALKQEDGTTMLPLRVSGSPSNINVTPDQEVIGPKIKNFFKDKGRDVLKNIFNRNTPKDTTTADTTSGN
jgi:hypothetical protein